MKVKDLEHDHPIIFERCMELMKENQLIYEPEIDVIGNIAFWRETKERFYVWNEVNIGNFAPFYKFHKIKNNLKPN